LRHQTFFSLTECNEAIGLVMQRMNGRPMRKLGVPTLAAAILDRIVHNAYRVELAGESLRKRQTSPKSKHS
jgi:DNA replication protein DnaC